MATRDAQRYRKIYSYYRPVPRETVLGSGGGVTEAVINGLDWKHSARAATTADITLSPAPASIDGVTLAPDDRVLVKDQTIASENGIYYYDAGSGDLLRTADGSDPALSSAAAIFIEGGTTNSDCAFVLVTADPITVGTTDLVWVKFAGAGSAIFTSSISPLAAKTNYSVSIDTDSRYAYEIGSDVFFFVSGSITASVDPAKSVFGGDTLVSGNLEVQNGINLLGDVFEMTGSLLMTGSMTLTGTLNISGSFAQGTNSLTIGADSHAEGSGSVAGAFGFIATVTTPGLIVLDPSYGDVTALFDPSIAWEYIVLQDSQYDDIYSSEVFKVASAAFNSPSTEITLVDSSVSTSTAIVGPQGSIIPSGADYVMGEYSHAEGVATARGPYSHAEGQGFAAGMYSHAEGAGSAYGSWSHAEGYDTAARGQNSHAEGNGTIAYGAGSHAAGLYTITVGNFSHAGGERTIASGSGQAAIGKYNLRDNDFSLFVVGNGTGDSNGARSDAFRVDVDSTQVTGSFFQINSGSSTVGFMGAAGGSLATIGNDVFFYVSGAIGSADKSLFGGDVLVSGSIFSQGDRLEMTGTISATDGFSGSLTTLTDGASYIVAGNNVTVVSQSNGSITISSTGGPSFFDSTTSGSIFTTGSMAFRGDETTVDAPSDKGSDVFFYVSGAIGSKNSATAGVSLFGGDVAVSGSLFAEGDILEVTGTLSVTQGISGSLTQLSDGTSYLIAGTNVTIVSSSNGPVTISGGPSFFVSTTSGSIFTTGSAAFRGDESSIDSPADKGADVFFYVSGSKNSKGTATSGVALFGGDVTVSGSFFAEGNEFEITGTLSVTQGISGSLTKLANGASYIVAGNNVTVASASNGSITITAIPTSPVSSLQFNSAGAFGGDSDLTYDPSSNTLTGVNAVFSGDLTVNGTTTTINTTNLEVRDAVIGLGFASGTISETAGDRGIIGGISGADHITLLWKNSQNEFSFGRTASSATGSLPIPLTSYANLHVANMQADVVTASLGFSGSLTTLSNGDSYLVAGGNVSVVSASNGSVTLSAVPTSPSDSVQFNNGGSFGGSSNFNFYTVTNTLAVTGTIGMLGDVIPDADASHNLGSPAKRWANVYTGDLHLRNNRGDWTIVEERDFLCVVNNVTGKRYKMMLQEIADDHQ